MGVIASVRIECSDTNLLSKKQWEELESSNAGIEMSVTKLVVNGMIRELEERVDSLSFNSVGAQGSSTQLTVHVESLELRSNFLLRPF